MRTGAGLLLLAGLLGCANPNVKVTPAPSNPDARDKADFDNWVSITWPAAPPRVERQVTSMELDEHENYTALYADKRPDGVVIFAAHIDVYPHAMWEKSSPEEILESTVFAFRKYELSRKPFAHGPHKYPGFDILSKRNDLTTRQIAVVAKPRVYTVSVSSKDETALTRPEVVAFFDSFAVRD